VTWPETASQILHSWRRNTNGEGQNGDNQFGCVKFLMIPIQWQTNSYDGWRLNTLGEYDKRIVTRSD